MDRLVLLVEDNDDHAELVRRAFRRHAADEQLLRVADGEEALSLLSDTGDPSARRPDVALLDLRLPRVNGFEVLRHIRQSPRLKHMPVVVLTTSNASTDVSQAYDEGANAYLVKPDDFSTFNELLRDFSRFWLRWNHGLDDTRPT